jgi:hypothetical protein
VSRCPSIQARISAASSADSGSAHRDAVLHVHEAEQLHGERLGAEHREVQRHGQDVRIRDGQRWRPAAAPQISEVLREMFAVDDTFASRDSMRGTSPPPGTSEGFRDIMIFGYIDQTAGARANSSECLACMGPDSRSRLRRESDR